MNAFAISTTELRDNSLVPACYVGKGVNTIDNVEKRADSGDKLWYMEGARIGVMVAFELRNGQVLTGKVTYKDDDLQQLRVVTKRGTVFDLRYSDVLWVNTNNGRWPKAIYRRMKAQKGMGNIG